MPIRFKYNLLPHSRRLFSGSYKRFSWLFRFSFVFFFWLLFVSVVIFATNNVLRRELALVREGSERLVTYNNHVVKSGLGKSVKSLEEETKILAKAFSFDYVWSETFLKVFQDIPAGIHLTAATAQSEEFVLVLTGVSRTREDLLQWQTELSSFDNVQAIDLPITTLFSKENFPFTMTLTLKKL